MASFLAIAARVPAPDVRARRDRRARAEGDRARALRGHGARARRAGPRVLHDVRAARLGAAPLDRVRAADVRARAARRRGRRDVRGRAAHAAHPLDRAGRDRAGRARHDREGLRLRRQGRRRRDGAAPRGRRDLDLDAAGGGARRGDRLAVHALPGVPRDARRRRRDPARARPLLRDVREGPRGGAARRAAPSGAHRPRDEGPRVAADRVPPHEHALRDRRRRVRRDGGHRSRSRT